MNTKDKIKNFFAAYGYELLLGFMSFICGCAFTSFIRGIEGAVI